VAELIRACVAPDPSDRPATALGGLPVPAEWLAAFEDLHASRQRQEVAK